MKKTLAIMLAVTMLICSLSAITAGAVTADTQSVGAPTSFETYEALYAHAVVGSTDTDAWQAWQSEHDEDFNVLNGSVKYFFLPSSANSSKVDIYNAYSDSVTVNGVSIASGATETVTYNTDTDYSVNAGGTTYTLKFMKSSAEAAIYINNSDADGNGTDLMTYINQDKSLSAKATGAIVDADGSIDNTAVKKIKGRGNTTWDKPKKAYNITYDSKVSIAGMSASKKFSILANYQDDSLSRNRFLYDLSDAAGMPYASDSRYVDFYVNGFYWGSYQMAEKVEGGSSSLIYDVDEEDYLNEDGTVKEDFPFVCEVDSSASDEDYYVKASNGNNITIKVPELEEGDTGYEEVKNYVKSKYDSLCSALKSRTADVSQYADIDSLAKIYLINELSKNWDAGVSSLFFTYKQDADGNFKFYGSPVWDYDNSLGNAIGVERELRNMGVDDYEEYSGWWCKYKGKKSNEKSSSNIMNNIARNTKVQAVVPEIWFKNFVPAINHFAGVKTNPVINKEMYTSDYYYSILKDSAEMNYQSGWLLDTGDWIADHTSLNKASYDIATQTYTVDSKATTYTQDFDGMYNYCADWLTSRAAWISSQLAESYTPAEYLYGDVNLDGVISIIDATTIQKMGINLVEYDATEFILADVNNDGRISIVDTTYVQKYVAEIGQKTGLTGETAVI